MEYIIGIAILSIKCTSGVVVKRIPNRATRLLRRIDSIAHVIDLRCYHAFLAFATCADAA